jgi:hypothetical protein
MSDEESRQQEQPEQEPNGERSDPLAELYERMSRTARENLERAGQFSEETFERALHEARDMYGRLRENYGEDVSRVAEYIRRDWNAALRATQEQYRRSVDFDRLQAGFLATMARLAKATGERLAGLAGRLDDRLTYKTGEIAGAGTLHCRQCDQALIFDKARRIPPCPKCHGTAFRRGY